jgi:hypothetical protein
MEKPKKPPPPTHSRLAGSALVETIDGPVEILTLVGKVMPVTTRLADGTIGFRMMINIRELAPEVPLLQFRNEEGQSILVGAEHIFVAADGSPIAAEAVQEGTELASGWSYPEGYIVPDAPEYAAHLRGKAFSNTVRIAGRGDAGSGPVYGATVKQTASYFLTFGACSLAQIV